ncbi:MAG: hypothetical protein AAF533_06695 [Acidobacteriota bacterium]
MSTLYHLTGSISTLAFVANMGGLVRQLVAILQRKRAGESGPVEPGHATEALSTYHFFVRFFAFWVMFVLGSSTEPTNHYLAWSRYAAIFIVLLILREIAADRSDHRTQVAWRAGLGMTVAATVAVFLYNGPTAEVRTWIARGTSIVLAALIFHSDRDQLRIMKEKNTTGAVSLTAHLTSIFKESTNLLFGWAMGLAAGWPLMLPSTVSLLTKSAIAWRFRGRGRA